MNLICCSRYTPTILIVYLLTLSIGIHAQYAKFIETFPINDVRLLDGAFKHAQDLNKEYLLMLDPDRLLAPFMREAGLPQKAESYTNWENTGLDGHIGGHYLSALSSMYASTSDKQIKERLDYMLSEMKRVQDANKNGYIGGIPKSQVLWEEIAQGQIKASNFALNDRWVPLYNIHKTYAGLRDAYILTDNNLAKEMLIKMAEWMISITENLSNEQIQQMLQSEHGGLNEIFADVADITGDEKYIKLARQFSHLVILNPLMQRKDSLTGMHANTQIPKILGYKRIADITKDTDWDSASQFFWETVVEKRSVCIGGNSANEHFHPSNDFSRMMNSTEGPETCNTYNMLRLTKMLFETSPEEKYIFYYERALYNHILSSQHPETGGLVYFTQMRPGHYRVYSQPQTSMWCCVGSGLENHAKYGEMIYAHTQDELYVNLFIPSTLRWEKKDIQITQLTNFPYEEKTELLINPKKETKFCLKLRYPSWVKKGDLRIKINGKYIPIIESTDNYISIDRKWEKGDSVIMEIPMHMTTEQLPDESNYFSFLYGPIVLAAKTNAEDLKGLFADDSRGGHIAQGKQISLNEMPIIVSDIDQLASLPEPITGKPLNFRLPHLFPQSYINGLELIPFYKLHDSRYIIYWTLATPDNIIEIQKRIEKENKERELLDSKTLDKITCGEQQPESDHYIQLENSWTGSIDGISWRECSGFFSYQLQNKDKKARQLYIAFFDKDLHRSLNVTINGLHVFSKKMEGNENDQMQNLYIKIPESETEKDLLEIKFEPILESEMTNKITEVRIID